MILQNGWLSYVKDHSTCPPLEKTIKTDILIIGGGVAGLHAAYTFLGKGYNVTLIEKTHCGGSSSGRSSGFLTPNSELELEQLIHIYGHNKAKIVWNMSQQGVDLIVSLIKKHSFKCDVQVQDSLFLGLGKSGEKEVLGEINARKEMGFEYTLYNQKELQSIHPTNAYSAAIRYPNSYGIISLLYVQELKKYLLKKGVSIFENTEAVTIKGTTVETPNGSVQANRIICCIDKMKSSLSDASKHAYHAQTFLTISEPLTTRQIKTIFPKEPCMCWDSQLTYTYYRLTGDKRLLIGGGSPLTTYYPTYFNSSMVINGVIAQMRDRFPIIKELSFRQYWPGLIDITKDLMPIVEYKKSEKIAYVMGCPGLPWAAFAGNHAASMILNKAPDYSEFLGMNRKFFISDTIQLITGKIPAFAISNLHALYT